MNQLIQEHGLLLIILGFFLSLIVLNIVGSVLLRTTKCKSSDSCGRCCDGCDRESRSSDSPSSN